MLVTFHALLASVLVVLALDPALALQERRSSSPKSADPLPGPAAGGTYRTEGMSSGPVAADGDPKISCPVIVEPSKWTVQFDPLPKACYEEGEQEKLKWSITDKLQPGRYYHYSNSPIINFSLFTLNEKRDRLLSPAMPQVVIGGVSERQPLCATSGEVTIFMPPKGSLSKSDLWPAQKMPWGVNAAEWASSASQGRINILADAPLREDVKVGGKGFVIAAAGGCKDFGK